MNIIEAYIKTKGHLNILISGMSGSGKSTLAKNIGKLFGLTVVNMNEYCNPNHSEKVKLLQDIEVINWDTDDVFDWNNLNNDMKNMSNYVLSGVAFPRDKIKFPVDFHIQIKLSKQNLFKRRQNYLDEHEKDCRNIDRNIDQNIEHTIFNQLTYTYYIDITNRSDVTRFLNANDFADLNNHDYNEKIFDEAYKILIQLIEKHLYPNK